MFRICVFCSDSEYYGILVDGKAFMSFNQLFFWKTSIFDVVFDMREVEQIMRSVFVNKMCFWFSFIDRLFGFRIRIITTDTYSCFIPVKSGIQRITSSQDNLWNKMGGV